MITDLENIQKAITENVLLFHAAILKKMEGNFDNIKEEYVKKPKIHLKKLRSKIYGRNIYFKPSPTALYTVDRAELEGVGR